MVAMRHGRTLSTRENGAESRARRRPTCARRPTAISNAGNFRPNARPRSGNPVNLLDGCKSQRELDYRSRTPGGLEVERFYNSAGYFRFDVAPERSTDVWRTTWDRRIVPPPVAGNVLAYAQRADGSILVFLPSGREMHNGQERRRGAAPAADRCGRRDDGMAPHHGEQRRRDLRRRRPSARRSRCGPDGPTRWPMARTASSPTVTDTLRRQAHVHLRCGGTPSGFVAPGDRAYVVWLRRAEAGSYR